MGGGPPSEGTDEASSVPVRRAGTADLVEPDEAVAGKTAALNVEAVAGAGNDDACDSPVVCAGPAERGEAAEAIRGEDAVIGAETEEARTTFALDITTGAPEVGTA